MGVIWKIALRNLQEHKKKTLIIGIIITVMITVLVIGNAVLDTASAGVRKVYIDNFTGDLILTGDPEGVITLFGRQDMSAMDKPTPKLPEFQKLKEFLEAQPEVAAISTQISGAVTLQYDGDIQGFSLLFGVDLEKYHNFFPDNIELLSGHWLVPGEPGMMLSERAAEILKENSEHDFVTGDRLIATGVMGGSGTNIRELEIKGIFRFRESNPQLDMVSLVDVENLRSLLGMTRGAELLSGLSTGEQELLGDYDSDSLFGSEDDLFGAEDDDLMIETVDVAGGSQTEESLLGILGDTSQRDRLALTDPAAWHFILIKLKNPSAPGGFIKQLKAFIAREDIPVAVRSWQEAAGFLAELTITFKTAFNIIIIIIAIVAIMIIMNTIVISVLERIPEIGTMRAIGAQRKFVRQMVMAETVLISGVFGFIGLLLGGIVLYALNRTGIPATNDFLTILFGGSVLKPVLKPLSVVLTFVIALAAGVVASLYPVHIALGIQPVKAIQAD